MNFWTLCWELSCPQCICSLVWTSFHVSFTLVSDAVSHMRAITLTGEIKFVNFSEI